MNLARVEYYFAKFLSAMEQRAREGTAELVLSPGNSVLLTPNLVFVGTVNVDETTHMFADKVFDRAQLIEIELRRELIAQSMAGTPYQGVLLEVWDLMRDVAPFAFRVVEEVRIYVEAADGLGVDWKVALDEQLLQKVLPKVRGGETNVQSALSRFVELTETEYPLSAAKAAKMHQGCLEHGFASYF